MGLAQGKEPLRREEGDRPALMIVPASPSASMGARAEDATEPHANPLVEVAERVVTVLEVRQPPDERAIDVRNNGREAVPVRAAGPDKRQQRPGGHGSNPKVTEREPTPACPDYGLLHFALGLLSQHGRQLRLSFRDRQP